jgi:steroid 5-alpha reductase family enzyme
MASPTRSSSRPSLAVVLGVVGVLAIPAAIVYSRESASFSLIDAAWLIPVAALASAGALLVVRGTGGHIRFSLAPVRTIRLGRVLAVIGICLTLSASIAVGFYELLLRLEG